MDSSNKEETIIIDKNLPAKEHLIDERERCKLQEIETCSKDEDRVLCDSCVNSPVKQQKRKSELKVEDEIKRKRSTDFVRKDECREENFFGGSDIQATFLTAVHSKKCKKCLITAAYPGNMEENAIKEQDGILNSVDPSISAEKNTETTDRTDSMTHAVQTSISFNNQNFNTESNYADKNEPLDAKPSISRHDVAAEKTLGNSSYFPIIVRISSINLKSDADLKSKNAQVEVDLVEDSHASRNQTEIKPSDFNNEFSDVNVQAKSYLRGNCEKNLLLQKKTNVSSTCDSIDVSDNAETDGVIISPRTFFSTKSASKNRVTHLEGDTATENASTFEEVPQKLKSDLPDKAKNKLEKSSNREKNRELELLHNISLRMDQNSTKMNKTEISNISKSCEYKPPEAILPKRQKIMFSDIIERQRLCRCISRTPYNSSENLISTSEFNSNNYTYKESEFITSKYFEANTGSRQIQQKVLESLSQQQNSDEHMKYENNIEDERQVPDTDYSIRSTKDRYTLCQENEVLRSVITFMKRKGNTIAETLAELDSQIEEYAGNLENIQFFKNNYPKCEEEARRINDDKKGVQETLENDDKSVNTEVLRENQRPSVTLSTTEIFSNGKTFQQILEEFESENHEKGESSEIYYPEFREYPGLAEELTKVKKDARFQKKFYKQKPIILPINWTIDINSPSETDSIDHKKDERQKTGEDSPNVSKDNEDRVPLLTHEKREECRADGLPETSTSGFPGYKVSSFMEESPTYSSPSDSHEENNELPLCALEKLSQTQNAEKWLDDHTKILSSAISVPPTDGEISFSQASSSLNIFENYFEIVTWAIVKYNVNNVSDNRAIFNRDITNVSPSDSSLIRPVRLRSYLKIICYADDRNEEEEFSIEEFLNILLYYQKEFLSQSPTNDPRLERRSFEIPLFKIPIKANYSLIPDDDYELVGDYLMQIV